MPWKMTPVLESRGLYIAQFQDLWNFVQKFVPFQYILFLL